MKNSKLSGPTDSEMLVDTSSEIGGRWHLPSKTAGVEWAQLNEMNEKGKSIPSLMVWKETSGTESIPEDKPRIGRRAQEVVQALG